MGLGHQRSNRHRKPAVIHLGCRRLILAVKTAHHGKHFGLVFEINHRREVDVAHESVLWARVSGSASKRRASTTWRSRASSASGFLLFRDRFGLSAGRVWRAATAIRAAV